MSEGARRYPGRAALVAISVALGGPLIGALLIDLTFFIWPLLVMGKPIGGQADTLGAVIGLIFYSAFFAYVFGALPAAVTGLLVGARVWQTGTCGYALTALIGASSAAVFAAAVAAQGPPRDWQGASQLAGVLGVTGAAAALVCRWLLGRFGVLARETVVRTV